MAGANDTASSVEETIKDTVEEINEDRTLKYPGTALTQLNLLANASRARGQWHPLPPLVVLLLLAWGTVKLAPSLELLMTHHFLGFLAIAGYWVAAIGGWYGLIALVIKLGDVHEVSDDEHALRQQIIVRRLINRLTQLAPSLPEELMPDYRQLLPRLNIDAREVELLRQFRAIRALESDLQDYRDRIKAAATRKENAQRLEVALEKEKTE